MLKQAVKAHPPIFPLAVLFIALVALLATSGTAQAGRSICRADPIVHFTDGTTLTMITDLDVDVAQIKKIDYTVTTPPGKVVDHIDYDVGGLGVKEKVTITASPSATGYTIDQYAKTYVAANVVAINTLNRITRSTAGMSEQHLVVTIRP
jgi:hypothetical protein